MRFLRSFALTGPPWLAAVLLTVLCAAQSASAAIVQYSTSGAFTSTGTNVVVSNDSSITFNGIVTALLDLGVGESSNASLGALDVTSVDSIDDNFIDTFTLTVHQTLPTSGSDSLVASLKGTVRLLNSKLVLDFGTDTTATIAPVFYELTKSIWNLPPESSNSGVTTLQATVSVVPLPAAAWGGMALFGVLGGAKLRRSRQSVLA
jgi:hypothetical protein